MNRILAVLALAAATSCSALPSTRNPLQTPGEDRDVTTISAIYGLRTLSDSDYWDPVDDTNTVGIEVDHYSVDDWVGFEVGAQLSDGDDSGFNVNFSEIYAGARKTFEINSFLRPYVAIGVTYLQSRAAADVVLDVVGQGPTIVPVGLSDESLGLYGRLGLLVSVSESISLGLEYRAVFGTTFEPGNGFSDGDADYGQFGLSVGYSF